MQKQCGGNGADECANKSDAHFEVKFSSVPGWRGLFCTDCLHDWLTYQGETNGIANGDKITLTVI
jgi:hypothetical protein